MPRLSKDRVRYRKKDNRQALEEFCCKFIESVKRISFSISAMHSLLTSVRCVNRTLLLNTQNTNDIDINPKAISIINPKRIILGIQKSVHNFEIYILKLM